VNNHFTVPQAQKTDWTRALEKGMQTNPTAAYHSSFVTNIHNDNAQIKQSVHH